MPANLLRKLAAQWDLWSGRYRVFFAESKEEREACTRVLDEVRRKELNRVVGGSVLESSAFSGNTLSYKLAGCEDTKTGEVIGCMRVTKADQLRSIESSREEYHLDLFPENKLNHISVFTRLAVLKRYRRSPAALVIMSHCFIDVLENGGEAILMSCEPGLFPMYKRMGLRPIGPPHNSPSGGYRIPMICIPDLDYLEAVGSPGLSLLRRQVDFDKYEFVCQWYREIIHKNGNLQLGAAFYSEELEDQFGEHKALTEGLSEDGCDAFLKNAVIIDCEKNDVLIAENDGGKVFGLVKEGFVKVLVHDNTVAILGPGDVFGEIAYILDINRSAKVVASSDETKVVLFSASAIRRLRDEDDQITIWRNLARILAQRVLEMNTLYAAKNKY